MTDTWFTSDLHLGHKNILEYEKESRPFYSLDEMHQAIITRWNNAVGKRDKVFVLGDVAFNNTALEIVGELNGIKHLIMGNHDDLKTERYLKFFKKLYGATFWKDCILTHVPVHPDNLMARSALNLHGHLHSNLITDLKLYGNDFSGNPVYFEQQDLNYFNVSLEQNDLYPINDSLIFERLQKIKIKKLKEEY